MGTAYVGENPAKEFGDKLIAGEWTAVADNTATDDDADFVPVLRQGVSIVTVDDHPDGENDGIGWLARPTADPTLDTEVAYAIAGGSDDVDPSPGKSYEIFHYPYPRSLDDTQYGIRGTTGIAILRCPW